MSFMTLAEHLPPVGSRVPVCKMKIWTGQSLKFLPGYTLGDRREVCGQLWEEASKCISGTYGHGTFGLRLADVFSRQESVLGLLEVENLGDNHFWQCLQDGERSIFRAWSGQVINELIVFGGSFNVC